MTELIEHQHAVAIGALHYLGQTLQFLGVDLVDVVLCIVDSAVGELGQLVHQRRGGVGQNVGGLALMLLAELQHLLTFKLVIGGQHRRRQLHGNGVHHHLGQLQVVLGLHTKADVCDAVAYHLLVSRSDVAPHHDIVPLVGGEVVLTVASHRPAQTAATIYAVHLPPQVNEPVGCRCAGKAYHALHGRTGYAHSLKALRLGVLKARQLVDHQDVKWQLSAIVAHQPHEVIAVDDIDVRLGGQGRKPLFGRAHHLSHPHAVEVVPLGGLSGPGSLRHLLGGNHKGVSNLAVVHKPLQGREGAHRLAETHIQEQPTLGIVQHPLRSLPLVVIRSVSHNAMAFISSSTAALLSITTAEWPRSVSSSMRAS